MEGKQFADAPESSAACTDDLVVASSILNVTLFVNFTCNALPVFRMDVGDLVDMIDTNESDEFAAVTACGGGSSLHPCTCLQLSIYGLPTALKRSFLGSWKRASIASDFSLHLSLDLDLKAYLLSAFG